MNITNLFKLNIPVSDVSAILTAFVARDTATLESLMHADAITIPDGMTLALSGRTGATFRTPKPAKAKTEDVVPSENPETANV